MKKILILGFLLVTLKVAAQDFTVEMVEDQAIVKSNRNSYSLLLDSKLTVSDILQPGDNFDILSSLGKPMDIEYSKDARGETYIYKYDGLELYFTDRFGTQELIYLKIYGNQHFLEIPSSQVSLRTNMPVLDLTGSLPNGMLLDLSTLKKIPMDFPNHESDGYDAWLTISEGTITEILFYF